MGEEKCAGDVVFRKGLRGLGLWRGWGGMLIKNPVQTASKVGPDEVPVGSAEGVGWLGGATARNRTFPDTWVRSGARSSVWSPVRAGRALVVAEEKEAVAAPIVIPPAQ